LKGATVTTPPAAAANPNALAFWPAGRAGYTIILESLPVANGRSAAVAKARQAQHAGLKEVGVLVSSQYSSLHTGYYAIFSGIFQSAAAAAAGVSNAHTLGFPDAYQTRVTR
jgi:hypothetical protein